MGTNGEPPPEDVFNILLATDIHLGYEEKDPIRGRDSFVTFEEILKIAVEREVDFILLGGDLFHISKASADSMHRCMLLLRKYCMGDRPISFEFLSDQDKNFLNTTQTVVNYEDPNINVSVPVFSIHGNHDDPVGQSHISSLDLLSCAGLVNYFGKNLDLQNIVVSPILLQKGDTRLALYGLSHVKDKRLVRLFEEEKVTFEQPTEHGGEWFNICVLHQNRAARGVKEYIPEDQLPEFMDLIVWGHEHDCRVVPEEAPHGQYHITQPGSSVATSLSEGEAIPKCVGLLKVYKKKFLIESIPLKTVRPFVFREICASEFNFTDDDMRDASEQLEEKAEETVNIMIQDAGKMLTDHEDQPTLPLIRLRFYYTDEAQMFNSVRFGQKFEDKIANPQELILMKRRVLERKEKRDVLDTEEMDRMFQEREDLTVEDYVLKYFKVKAEEGDESHCMSVLTALGLNEAVKASSDHQKTEAIEEIVKYQTERMKNYLLSLDINERNIDDEIKNFIIQKSGSERQDIHRELEKVSSSKAKTTASRNVASKSNHRDSNGNDEADQTIEDPDDEFEEEVAARGRGRGRGARTTRAARAPRASRGSRASSSSNRSRTAPQRTLPESFASQKTSSRSTANRSKVQFLDDDED
ncbi:Double-strand break repair protein MRE11 [Frankliniella fusca]|uniref:Double-strand break repair protein n=1 Tax=Frankliniella fusca TaxID=407009 RepID=A0AAE1LAZ9_9NEOP|nr:Double-strand break repair protein MRE11 [Frankliniella fusca]